MWQRVKQARQSTSIYNTIYKLITNFTVCVQQYTSTQMVRSKFKFSRLINFNCPLHRSQVCLCLLTSYLQASRSKSWKMDWPHIEATRQCQRWRRVGWTNNLYRNRVCQLFSVVSSTFCQLMELGDHIVTLLAKYCLISIKATHLFWFWVITIEGGN